MNLKDESQALAEAREQEKKALELNAAHQYSAAFYAFDSAGRLYQIANETIRAAICFASAATCWSLYTGNQSMRNAATRNELAAHEAIKICHYDYARWLFREAALLFEKEGDYESFSRCFLAAEEAHRRHHKEIFLKGKNVQHMGTPPEPVNIHTRIRSLIKWIFLTLSKIIWGYGEKPFLTLGFAASVVFCCAVIYFFSNGIKEGQEMTAGFGNYLYFSIVTFTTVGFGDLLPVGWVRVVVSIEALSGIIIMPLFLIGLSRRYLRLYR